MDNKTFLRQLFCRHIYKEVDREILYWTRAKDGGRGYWNMPTYSNYVCLHCTDICVKCKKENHLKRWSDIGNATLARDLFRES